VAIEALVEMARAAMMERVMFFMVLLVSAIGKLVREEI
jgi:hypothetical protein